ncbi:hypothetical protein, partial [Ralstonia pseudosolanacearum]|uniref:hypothetical protein n=1 Tax=Ralstonia pseudosolanacearum TaxID=1310165 RepID=UPI003CF58438
VVPAGTTPSFAVRTFLFPADIAVNGLSPHVCHEQYPISRLDGCGVFGWLRRLCNHALHQGSAKSGRESLGGRIIGSQTEQQASVGLDRIGLHQHRCGPPDRLPHAGSSARLLIVPT